MRSVANSSSLGPPRRTADRQNYRSKLRAGLAPMMLHHFSVRAARPGHDFVGLSTFSCSLRHNMVCWWIPHLTPPQSRKRTDLP